MSANSGNLKKKSNYISTSPPCTSKDVICKIKKIKKDAYDISSPVPFSNSQCWDERKKKVLQRVNSFESCPFRFDKTKKNKKKFD